MSQFAVLREAHDRKSRYWPATHCINIAQCIGSGNLTEGKGVVYKRSKKIDSLDDCKVRRDPVDACVIRGIEANEQV